MTAPAEPPTERTIAELLADRLTNPDSTLTTDEHDQLYAYLWANPTLHATHQIRAAFPEIRDEIVAAARDYQVRQDGSGYAARGERGETGGRQATGLDAGLVWVVRYVGECVGFAYDQDGAWGYAKDHFLLLQTASW
jgi:hypothetical protein